MRHCDDPPPKELLLAVEQFNRGDWYECHETLEELWVGERWEMRDFYQGLLQLAAALHHWREGNLKGATLLLEKGANLLRRVPPVCQTVELEPVLAAADRLGRELSRLGPERMASVDPKLIPKLTLSPLPGGANRERT